MFSHTLLRWLDQLGAALVCRAMAFVVRDSKGRGLVPDRRKVERIVIVKLCCLGDALLMGPALRAIRCAYPHAEITVLTTARTSGVFPRLACVERVLELPLSLGPFEILRCLGNSAPKRPDLFYCFEPWYPAATLIACLTGARCKVGFVCPRAPYNRSLFDLVVAYEEDKHVVEAYLALAEAGIGRRWLDKQLQLSITAQEEQTADRFFQEHLIERPVVGLFPGSSPRWRQKRWPSDRFALLADRLVCELGLGVLILTGKGQERVSSEVFGQMRQRAVVVPGQFSFGELAAIIKRCSLLVSADSSPMHIAASVGTPVVALFGPVNPTLYRPYLTSGMFRIVRRELPCSPCVAFGKALPCPIDFECIRSIEVDEVFDAVRSLLASSRGGQSVARCT